MGVNQEMVDMDLMKEEWQSCIEFNSQLLDKE
jgi:hypothetical protein